MILQHLGQIEQLIVILSNTANVCSMWMTFVHWLIIGVCPMTNFYYRASSKTWSMEASENHKSGKSKMYYPSKHFLSSCSFFNSVRGCNYSSHSEDNSYFSVFRPAEQLYSEDSQVLANSSILISSLLTIKQFHTINLDSHSKCSAHLKSQNKKVYWVYSGKFFIIYISRL